MKTINLNPTWKSAARIFLACLKDGDSAEAKKGAEDEIMRMAENLDTYIDNAQKAQDSQDFELGVENRDPWLVEFCGGVYEICYCENRPRLSPKWAVVRMNDLAESERYYSQPNGAFTALSTGAINWRK